MLTAAFRIDELVKSLGVEKARLVGHDIGLMVAYADAAQFPAETEKLVVMDAFPGRRRTGRRQTTIWDTAFSSPRPDAAGAAARAGAGLLLRCPIGMYSPRNKAS